MTVHEIIELVRARYRRDADEELRAGASEAEVQQLKDKVSDRYGVDLPDGFLGLLRQVNGFGNDGYGFYASAPLFSASDDEWPAEEGLIEANEGMEMDGVALPNAVCLGYGEDNFFGINRSTSELWMFDEYKKPVKRFKSFEDMFSFMFDRRT